MEARVSTNRVVASLDQWAAEARLDRATVSKALRALHALGLIEYTPGRAGLHRKACEVRRRNVDEVVAHCPREILERFTPPDFSALADALRARGVPWGSGTVFPRWNVQITGRIGPSGAPPAGVTKAERLHGFLAALRTGETLYDIDIRAAEPSILLHELRRLNQCAGRNAADIYESLSRAAGCNRDRAKRLFQSVIYSKAMRVIPPHDWPPFLRDLIKAVDTYRNDLWTRGAPSKGLPRFTHTVGGRRILHDGQKRMHRGRLLSWRLQGTVADIVMKTVAVILRDERELGVRFFCQAHDSIVFAAADETRAVAVQDLMLREATQLGIGEIRLKTAKHTATDTPHRIVDEMSPEQPHPGMGEKSSINRGAVS